MAQLNTIENNIYEFNRIAGNLDRVDKEKLLNQLALIKEELNETIDALKDDNPLETLDGVCDVFVTAMGLMQIYEQANKSAFDALIAVTENNLTKYPKSSDIAAQTVELYQAQGIETIIHFDTQSQSFVCKDMNGKVRKPFGYIPVDLREWV